VALGLLAVVGALSGCQVHTAVSIDAGSGGSGTVAVSVSLDAAALSAVGGQKALAGQLADTDLTKAGWVVIGPTPGPNATTVITATHSYRDPAEAATLVASLAGTGSASTRPFQVELSNHRSFWHVGTQLRGAVNLSCGLSCFGDSSLQALLGSPVGVNSTLLEQAARQQPAQVFTFSVEAHLPGSLKQTDAPARAGQDLQWSPTLGHTVVLSAQTEDWDWGHVTLVAVLAGVGLVLVLTLLIVLLWRRRRRRKRGTGSDGGSGADGRHPPRNGRGRHAKPRRLLPRTPKAVTPQS
jgi:hypothetical protein